MSLARALRRSALLVRLRRAQWTASCAIALALCALVLASEPRLPAVVLALGALCLVAVLVALVWPVERMALARALDRANGLEGRVVAALEFAASRSRTPFMDAALRDVEARTLSVRGVLPRHPTWLRVLALAPWVAIASFFAYRASSLETPSVQRASAPKRSDAPTSRAEALTELAALATEVSALEAQLAEREAARQRVLEPLRTALVAVRSSTRERHDAPTSTTLRSLADALTLPKLSPELRAQLQRALVVARAREHARLSAARERAQARLSTAQRHAQSGDRSANGDAAHEPLRQLAQRPRPNDEERLPDAQGQLDQVTRPRNQGSEDNQPALPADAQRQLEQLTRPHEAEHAHPGDDTRQREQPARTREDGRPSQAGDEQRQLEQLARPGEGERAREGEHAREGDDMRRLAHSPADGQPAQASDERRQLEQLTRPRDGEHAHPGDDARQLEQPRQREGEQPTRPGERRGDEQLAGAGQRQEQRAEARGDEQDDERGVGTRGAGRQVDAHATDERRALLERALRESERDDEQLAQQLTRAAEALARGDDAEAARALREGARALDQPPHFPRDGAGAIDRERASREQASAPHHTDLPERAATVRRVAGGGSELDPGDHAPAERRIGGSYQDVRVRGVHGEGPSRSQVIEGASQAGFASLPYRRVYADYRAHAEQLLERDDVPASERFYVRRYFQLVEPR